MAEESGKPEYLDPDEQEFHILIIAKDAFMLNRSAQFLTKRGWPTTVATSLQEAIQKAVTGKPDYIFVSVDHHLRFQLSSHHTDRKYHHQIAYRHQ